GRWKIFRTILRRLHMIDGEDSSIALKHAYGIRHSDASFDNRLYRIIQKRGRYLMGPQFPHAMSVKMTLKPLGLNPRVQKTVAPMIAFLSRYLLWGEGSMRIKSYDRMLTDFYTRLRVYALNQWARFAG
ncbi:MAG: hypothetical protein KGI32_10510, partial [Gammaproteobacteria bacterium]|nr:hypothetical protein [Gammaproteobacteria bacterium]